MAARPGRSHEDTLETRMYSLILRFPGLLSQQLADRLGMKRQNVSQVLLKLERAGKIEKRSITDIRALTYGRKGWFGLTQHPM